MAVNRRARPATELVCDWCGCVIASMAAHEEWHARLDAMAVLLDRHLDHDEHGGLLA